MKQIIATIALSLVVTASYCQHENDFPSDFNYSVDERRSTVNRVCGGKEVKHRAVTSNKIGEEYYCNGRLHATGPLKKLKSEYVINAYGDNREYRVTSFVREDRWTVYFDSIALTIRSTGNYKDGVKDGVWKIYSENGSVKYLIEFDKGLIKTKTAFDESGKRKVLIARSDGSIFVEQHKLLLILIAAIPITLFRIPWNILTYNKANKTSYIPFLQDFQEGGFSVNVMCTVIFWWFIKKEDTDNISDYKKTGNVISIISLLCFSIVMTLVMIYE